jgi:hypothetical protein
LGKEDLHPYRDSQPCGLQPEEEKDKGERIKDKYFGGGGIRYPRLSTTERLAVKLHALSFQTKPPNERAYFKNLARSFT